jgi:hypothetical protein
LSSQRSRRAEITARNPRTIEVTSPTAQQPWLPDYQILTLIASLISLASFMYFYTRGDLLLYGDAVAHMNIARRVVDSRTPGLLQLGTVWLPLPHLLMLPFIWSTSLWMSGVAGTIPSMVAYIASVVGIFRLVWVGLSLLPERRREARFVAWLAALAFTLNPNLLYLETTAMTELIYLACYIWATVYFAKFAIDLKMGEERAAQRALIICGVFLCLGALTRYDGWFAAALYAIAALITVMVASKRSGLEWWHFVYERGWRRATIIFVAVLAFTPAVWLTYNALAFDDPLSFMRGPYSARAIEERSRKPGDWRHPGWDAPQVGTEYFVKAAELNMAAGDRSQRIWLYAALLGSVMALGFLRPLWPWLLLWTPVPFYAISIAWGGVPIFIPTWWPFSYYNVRYGTQLIPVFVVFGALLLYLFLSKFSWRRLQYTIALMAMVFVGWNYYYDLKFGTPISLKEAQVNGLDRIAIERQLAREIMLLPTDSTIMMYVGEHGGALQRIGFPLRRTISEGNHRYWGSALLNPAAMANYVIATDGDPVANAIKAHPQGLEEVTVIQSLRQNPITIYRSTEYR